MQTKWHLGWNTTKWSVKIFKEWQSACSYKVVANESPGFDYEKVEEVQDLRGLDCKYRLQSFNTDESKFLKLCHNKGLW